MASSWHRSCGARLRPSASAPVGIGYPGGSLLLLTCVVVSLGVWRAANGSISVDSVHTPRAEIFYWITITFSQTLGIVLGDWIANSGLGYEGGALVFVAGQLVLVAAYHWTRISRVLLFWTAFILTRPLGATLGDLFDKPVA